MPVLYDYDGGDRDRDEDRQRSGDLDRHEQGEQRNRHQGFAEAEDRTNQCGNEDHGQHLQGRPIDHQFVLSVLDVQPEL